MAAELFVDTSGFYALLVLDDAAHERAVAVMNSARGRTRFVTTDYVLDEAATLLKARGASAALDALFGVVRNSSACQVVWVDEDLFLAAQTFFTKHLDQGYSFTDCISFMLMRRRRIRAAMTTDSHFTHAGYEALLA